MPKTKSQPTPGTAIQVADTPGGGGPSPGVRQWTLVGTASKIAEITLQPRELSWHLIVPNFSFAIPATATIRGIEVKLETEASLSDAVICRNLYLTKDGQTRGIRNKGNSLEFLPSFPPKGGPRDLWRENWAQSEIIKPNFGVILQLRNNIGPDTVDIELLSIEVTVWWKP